MRIALDYDGTFTECPELWFRFIRDCNGHKHEVCIVTFRGEDTPIGPEDVLRQDFHVKTYYTNRQAKRDYMLEQGIPVDIWIDDNPDLIVHGSNWSQAEVDEWKAGLIGGQSG